MIAIRAALLLALLGAPAFAQAKPTPAPPLSQAEVTNLAPKVRGIRAEPQTITMHVGQIVALESIAVTVLDSLGNVRGRLVGYDFSIAPGQAASARPFKITAEKQGTAELVIHYPRASWTARKDPRPEAKVKIVVKA